MAAHQAPPSMGFSREEHWSGLPFPSPMREKWKVKVKSLSRVWVLATPWTAAHQAPPSMGFSRQECWSGVPLPSPQYVLRGIQSALKKGDHDNMITHLCNKKSYKVSSGKFSLTFSTCGINVFNQRSSVTCIHVNTQHIHRNTLSYKNTGADTLILLPCTHTYTQYCSFKKFGIILFYFMAFLLIPMVCSSLLRTDDSTMNSTNWGWIQVNKMTNYLSGTRAWQQ